MGIFGFLSKAHNDQNLVSGDVQSKIAIYDEKIKTARDNIEADRKQLKQMDEAVDQVMGRSSDEKGADKAVAIRRSQAKDRAALAKDIEANQKLISTLNDEAAPIRAEVRKVEAEVGPLKYIAKFIYDEKVDENMLEKAVTWIIILIVIVFDPLAVIMLLAAQMTFAWHRNGHDPLAEETPDPYVADVGEKPTEEELQPEEEKPEPFVPDSTLWPFPSAHELQAHTEEVPANEPSTALGGDITAPEEQQVQEDPVEQWNKMIEEAEKAVEQEKKAIEADLPEVDRPGDYLTDTDSKKKTYMTKDDLGQIQVKSRS
jgi:hypothetical protein